MSNNSYTDKQIEADNLLRSIGKGEMSAEIIDEIVSIIGESENKTSESLYKKENVDSIKLRLLDEPDWKKRAALAAILISKSLE
jgi:hypothetical protein